MKKIMIYTKHSPISSRGLSEIIRTDSGMILCYISLICGVMTGSSFGAGLKSMGLTVLDRLLDPINIKNDLILSLIFYAVLIMIAFMGALSCFGTFIQIAVNFISGAVFGTAAAYYLSAYLFNGYLRFSLMLLPGTVISQCGLIYFTDLCCKMSNSINVNLFTDKKTKIELKTLLLSSIIGFSVCAAGGLVNILAVRLLGNLK